MGLSRMLDRPSYDASRLNEMTNADYMNEIKKKAKNMVLVEGRILGNDPDTPCLWTQFRRILSTTRKK